MEKLCCLLKQLYKLLVIRVIRKKILTSSGTVHHMMPGIRVVYSQGPRHDENIPEFTTKVNRRFDPKSSLVDVRQFDLVALLVQVPRKTNTGVGRIFEVECLVHWSASRIFFICWDVLSRFC